MLKGCDFVAHSIEPKLQKIGQYLELEGKTIFRIPEYQRPYAWTTDNCDKLWQDIQDMVSDYSDSQEIDGARVERDPYFFGTIIISCQENDTRFDLIDGQQRTTTFLLLLKALLICVNDALGKMPNDADSWSLLNGLKIRRQEIIKILYKAEAEEIREVFDYDSDSDIYKRPSIIQNKSVNEQHSDDLLAILQSVDLNEAEGRVYKFARKQKDNKYTNFFRNFKFFFELACKLTPPQLNVFIKTFLKGCEIIQIKSWQVEQAISMFNSLNSDGMPLNDADIISAKLYASAKQQNITETYTQKWTDLIRIIAGLKQNGIGDIDAILMQQMYYERAINKNHGIVLQSESGKPDVTTPGLRKYYTNLRSDLLENPIVLCDQLLNLAKIWVKLSEEPIIQVLLKLNVNSKLYLASYFQRFKADEITAEDVLPIAECLVRLFTVLELVDIGYSSSEFKTFLFGEILKLANKNVPVQEIEEDFSTHISTRPNNKWSRDSIGQSLMEYDNNALVYLNEYLFAKENGYQFLLDNKYDIEHIMPASGANIQEIRIDAGIENNDEFRSIVNLLGNKIVLEEKINRAVGNEWFRTKVSATVTAKKGYRDSKYPLAQAFVKHYGNLDKKSWGKEDIIQATEEIKDRILNFIFGVED